MTKRPRAVGVPMEASRALGAPLHQQIYLVLREQILSGRYDHGRALPTENELTAMFNVSRITVRRALQTLAEVGLVERHQGRGTFVRQEAVPKPLQVPIANLFESLGSFDAHTSVEVVAFGEEEPPAQVRGILRLGDRERTHRIVRVRSQHGTPVMRITTFAPLDIGATFTEQELRTSAFFKLLERAAHVTHAEQIVTAKLADPEVAHDLRIAIGSPLLVVVRIYFAGDRPVCHLEYLAPPELFQLRMVLRE